MRMTWKKIWRVTKQTPLSTFCPMRRRQDTVFLIIISPARETGENRPTQSYRGGRACAVVSGGICKSLNCTSANQSNEQRCESATILLLSKRYCDKQQHKNQWLKWHSGARPFCEKQLVSSSKQSSRNEVPKNSSAAMGGRSLFYRPFSFSRSLSQVLSGDLVSRSRFASKHTAVLVTSARPTLFRERRRRKTFRAGSGSCRARTDACIAPWALVRAPAWTMVCEQSGTVCFRSQIDFFSNDRKNQVNPVI